ncbi:MAG: 2-dehydro-3-deoxyphosphooctonate aldolase [Flavobacteriaceae bacterium]|nr:MAG: 2-dehydro-3-deoxyphosphooctonate aldolase [Flavobacteriaceae bacterium]
MNPIEQHILNQKEPYQSLMLYIRSVIKKNLPEVEEKYSYNIPFFNIDKKPMLYLNVLKGTDFLDVAFVQGIFLETPFPELKDDNNRKQVRSLQVKSLEDFDELRFVEMLLQASENINKSKRAWNP